MSLFMSFLMSGVITLINLGLVSGFILFWLEAFWKAWLIAFPIILVVVPQVKRVVRIVVRDN